MARWWWEQPQKPTFDIEYIEEKNGKWTFTIGHNDHVDTVGNVQGLESLEQAQAAVAKLAEGFNTKEKIRHKEVS